MRTLQIIGICVLLGFIVSCGSHREKQQQPSANNSTPASKIEIIRGVTSDGGGKNGAPINIEIIRGTNTTGATGAVPEASR